MIDIDVDLSPEAKAHVTEYLRDKFGEERVMSVGTYTKMGVASAAKDLMRIYEVPFKESNAFTGELDSQESWEQNLERIKATRPDVYLTYEKYKEVLDLTPYFINKVRQCLPYYQEIDTNNGKRKICDLNPEKDFILFLNKKEEISQTDKYSVFKSGKKKIYEITTEGGKKIRATEEHVFFLRNSCKRLKDLNLGDEIVISSCV